jgi:hypothetical protein
MGRHVRVGVPNERSLVGKGHPAEDQHTIRVVAEAVYIKPLAHSNL